MAASGFKKTFNPKHPIFPVHTRQTRLYTETLNLPAQWSAATFCGDEPSGKSTGT
jgi:hypothetical protein